MRVSAPRIAAVVVALVAVVLVGRVARDDSSPNRGSTAAAPPNGKPIVTRSSDSLRAEERAGALAAARGLGLQPLAALRRDAPVPRCSASRACDLWQQLRDDRRTLAAARRPPRLAATRGGSRPRSSAPSAARVGARRGAAARAPRAAHDHPGPPRAAPVLPLAAPVRDPQRGAGASSASPTPSSAPCAGRSSARWTSAGCTAARRAQVEARGDRGAARARARRASARRDAGARRAGCCCAASSRQLPRWLDQARYNGPPPTHRGALVAVPRDYASNPAISATAATSPTRPTARSCRSPSSSARSPCCAPTSRRGRSTLVSAARATTGPDPLSAYNPTISGDGARVAFESSAGNQNFAKRYGRIGVAAARPARPDATTPSTGRAPRRRRLAVGLQPGAGRRRRARGVPGRARRADARSSSATCRRPRRASPSRGARGRRRPLRRPLRARAVGRRHEARLHAGARACRRPARARTSEVLVRDLRTARRPRQPRADGRGATASRPTRRSRPTGASSPSPSSAAPARRGRRPAAARPATRPDAAVPDRRRARLDPVVARGGAVVAFTASRGGRARVHGLDARRPARRRSSAARAAPRARRDGASERPVDLRRRPPRRVRLDGDEPRPGQARRHPRDLRARPAARGRRAWSATRRRLPEGALAARRRSKPRAAGARAARCSRRPRSGRGEVAITDNAFVRRRRPADGPRRRRRSR